MIAKPLDCQFVLEFPSLGNSANLVQDSISQKLCLIRQEFPLHFVRSFIQIKISSPAAPKLHFLVIYLIMQKVSIQRSKKSEAQIQSQQTIPMLSELFIQLPKPNPARRISLASQQAPYINEYQTFFPPDGQEIPQNTDKISLENGSNDGNAPSIRLLRHKFPQSPPHNRTEGEIILGWIRNLFQKKNLLGPHWEQKIRKKKVNFLKAAFDKLKQERQSVCSPYLQTQSKHKPYFNKQKHLLVMGFEKYSEVCSSIIVKIKRTVFSKVLRYLAFHHAPSKPNSKLESFNFQQESTGSLASKNHAREQRYIQESPKNANLINPVFSKQASTPRKITIGNDYVVMQQNQLKTPIKQVQSSKNLIFSANEYALSPVSPVKELLTDKKKPIKESNFVVTESKMSRQSEKGKVGRELINSKSQPHQLAIGGIGGNFKYQFNQHNYIVVQPDHQLPVASPPSPLSHQFTPTIKFHAPEVRQINIQPIPMVMKQSTQKFERRDANYVRPHSHNPFLAQNNQNAASNQKIPQDKTENRKSRSISASANIKISFMSKEDLTAKQVKMRGNDYLQQEKLKHQDIHRLGTAENRKMRQHYQINSYGHELIPQDYIISPQTPNYLHSMPASPKPQELHSKHIHVNYTNLGPQSATPRSPRAFGYQSYLPISPETRQIPRQMKQSVQMPSPESSKRVVRQKILVTSSQRAK